MKAGGKLKVPKLNLASGVKQAPETPKSSTRRMEENEVVRLQTLHESDYADDPMNVGHMATTNMSHDSDTVKEAEQNFKQMLDERHDDDKKYGNHQKEPDQAAIDDQEEETKESGEPLPSTLSKQLSDGSKGANLVIEDTNRNTAIEIFENYFARAYKRRENAPMHEKRFMRVIDRVKNRENLDDAYIA